MKKLIFILFILSCLPLQAIKIVRNIKSGIVITSEEAFPVSMCTVYTDDDVTVDSFSTEGALNNAINLIPASSFPNLPESGTIHQNQLYAYEGYVVRCLQDHERTIYDPLITPALFAVYRENSDELLWAENESVMVGWKRTYESVLYECLQSHMTLLTWIPTNTLGVLWKIVQQGDPDCETAKEWNAADHWTTYSLGDKRTNAGKLWEVINVGFTYYEPSGPYGSYGWKYLKDCP